MLGERERVGDEVNNQISGSHICPPTLAHSLGEMVCCPPLFHSQPQLMFFYKGLNSCLPKPSCHVTPSHHSLPLYLDPSKGKKCSYWTGQCFAVSSMISLAFTWSMWGNHSHFRHVEPKAQRSSAMASGPFSGQLQSPFWVPFADFQTNVLLTSLCFLAFRTIFSPEWNCPNPGSSSWILEVTKSHFISVT